MGGRAKRLFFAGTGVLLVGLGAVGVILPGLPTTIFLLGASWCLVRSSPRLERRLLRSRLFAPYWRLIDGDEPMSTRARILTIGMIWVATGVSLAVFDARGLLGVAAAPLVGAALVGAFFVWRFRRPGS